MYPRCLRVGVYPHGVYGSVCTRTRGGCGVGGYGYGVEFPTRGVTRAEPYRVLLATWQIPLVRVSHCTTTTRNEPRPHAV